MRTSSKKIRKKSKWAEGALEFDVNAKIKTFELKTKLPIGKMMEQQRRSKNKKT